ncbi:alkyl/aryl-sulfatase [Collinsella aerofaciens]|uniref:alkyl/aryl-sulfatase n=1 Tax=Collinsella aerofaciens TaxID=74426 RepID=UPI003D7A10F5
MCNACNTPNLGRRQFLGGMALAGAGIATTGIFASLGLAGCASGSASLNLTSDKKDATKTTAKANKAFYDKLDFSDKTEYENATRNLIASPDALEIKNDDGNVVWSQKAYTFVEDADAPDSANPSLWENTRNNHVYGLFKVVDGIYQVRGYDMSNLTLVEGETGWIVFDTLMSVECSQAALALANEQLGARPVKAVVVSHPHVDHYGGIKGVISAEDAASEDTPIEQQLAGDKVPVIVPQGFLGHAVSENSYAGYAMGRRAAYQYGGYLKKGARGSLAMGIGNGQSSGKTSFIRPSYEVATSGEWLTIDGVRMQFQLTPGTESPAEMNTWIPSLKALWVAENCTGTLHNLYTLRGAQVRDGNAWAKYITEAVALYGAEVEVTFQSHNWPHWGNAAVNEYLVNTAATYKFINDQALSMLNNGKVSTEIAHEIALPQALEKNWYTRQYYGTVAHNAKAVYQRFMGWYDANPVHLHELPPEDFAKKMVDYLGDTDKVLKKAKEDFDKGEYQWVAQITNILVFADPKNTSARLLCADALEQLGYQSESGTWRNCYLTAALELRQGNYAEKMSTFESSPDTRNNMTTEMILDYLGIALDKSALADQDIKVNLTATDTGEQFLLRFKNGPLLHFEGMHDDAAELSIAGPRQSLLLLMAGSSEKIKQAANITGDMDLLDKLCGVFTELSTAGKFNIIEP